MKNEITNEIRQHIAKLYSKWLDLLAVRDNAKPQSARYWKAVDQAEVIENEASMLVFGDTAHTMTEAYEEKEADEI